VASAALLFVWSQTRLDAGSSANSARRPNRLRADAWNSRNAAVLVKTARAWTTSLSFWTFALSEGRPVRRTRSLMTADTRFFFQW
jgi:hypothetical protein